MRFNYKKAVKSVKAANKQLTASGKDLRVRQDTAGYVLFNPLTESVLGEAHKSLHELFQANRLR